MSSSMVSVVDEEAVRIPTMAGTLRCAAAIFPEG